MDIILSVASRDLEPSREFLEHLSPEELAHKFILFLSAERRQEELRNRRYSAETRSLLESARAEAETEKCAPDLDKNAVRERFSDTCNSIAEKRNHG